MTNRTWTITTEHTVLTRIVVAGSTEDEALENYYEDNYIDIEEVDAYDGEIVGVEEDKPELSIVVELYDNDNEA